MVTYQNYCEVETWTVAELVDACSFNPVGKRRISIPEFQRRLVWNTEKQERLIASIKQGYPIGSLLLYEDLPSRSTNETARRVYRMIDGLQRTQALRTYVDEPTKFFTQDDVTEGVMKAALRAMEAYETNEDKINSIVVKWVRSLSGFTETDGWGVDGFIRALTDELPFEPQSDEYIRAYFAVSQDGLLKQQLAQFLKDVREASDISKAQLPVVIYNGPSSELPTVFELLNSQGTVLSRYEIYAAQWIDHRQKIANENIIKAIWRKYEALEDEGFTLDVAEAAPDNRARKHREYTLFEYLFGFGQFLSDQYRQLFKSVVPDRPSSAGFNLVASCSGMSVKDMEKLPEHLKQVDREELERAIVESISFVQDVLNPVLSVKQQTGRASIYHSEFQIISMIATAFHVRYDVHGALGEIEGWRTQRHKLKRDLPMFYLYDILRDYWRGSGDTKLNEVVTRLRYLSTPPSWASWQQVLDSWCLDNQATLQQNRRFVRDATPEILLLKYIYVHKLTVAENALPYHVEHVIPVDQLIRAMGQDDKWPINSVSNLALLRAEENQRKNNKTFKEYWDKALAIGEITSREHEEAVSHMEDQLICPRQLLPSSLNATSFADFLMDRFERLKQAFFDAWQESIPQ